MTANKFCLLAAEKNGDLTEIPGLEPCGMKAGHFFRIGKKDLIRLHPDSEIFILPDRLPVGLDPESGRYLTVDEVRTAGRSSSCYAAAAFLPPGYTALYSAAYREMPGCRMLPLFSYSPVFTFKGELYASGIRIDREKRQELAGMDDSLLRERVLSYRDLFPYNRLVRHLEKCALTYCCPAAKNFFLERYEAPLPSSPSCNSRCIGCISHQPGGRCPVTQPRIDFVPSASEIAGIALHHFRKVKDPVVSFGQGCEGEPLLSAPEIKEALRMIRAQTGKGMINLNTNASLPEEIEGLFDAGLDSIRVSVNSLRAEHYRSYYRPRGYVFEDVMRSIKVAKEKGGFVSINYLSMPGFTDLDDEAGALMDLLSEGCVDMIQWRNLNYDPAAYFRDLGVNPPRQGLIGMRVLINSVKREFPGIMNGYFNPSPERIKRFRKDLCERGA
jgi:MoaA/NifB/PqqE/SkfB family radical SAM enzyme